MAITFTAQQVIDRAASDLGRWVPGEALGAVEQDVLQNAYSTVLSEISKIIVINDPDQVPALIYDVVCNLTAIFAASAFGNTPIDYNAVERVEFRLRYLVSQTPTYEPVMAYYF